MRASRRFNVCALVCVFAGAALNGQAPDNRIPGPDQWVSTFSIIALDPDTGQLGVGVQSRAFAAGATVPWAKAGVGAVATQAAANRTYGPKAIALLEQGLSPADVIKKITDDDPGRDLRQVAVIDAKGRSAAYTGKHVIDRNTDPKDRVHLGGWAGSRQSVNFSVQGNTLASEAVVNAMTEAYAGSTATTMAERLMDALDAGQSKGGDIRGMQAAGILVVQTGGPDATTDHLIDIRVDDAPNPFKELRRVLNVRLSGDRMRHATALAKKGQVAEALAEQKLATTMNPTSEFMLFGLAERYADAGEYLHALNNLQQAIAIQPYLKLDAMESASFSKMKDSVDFKQLVAK